MKFNKTLVPAMLVMLAASNTAFAAEGASSADGYIAIGAGLAISVAALGGGLGQGMAASSMYQSVARNPQAAGALNTPFILGLALIESLVIYALVIAYLLQGKIV